MPFDALPEQIDLISLRLARDSVAKPGAWHQGSIGSRESDQFCALGWMVRASDFQMGLGRAGDLLFPGLPWRYRMTDRKYKTGSVAAYNDIPWRSQKAIVRLFDRAIRHLEQQIARAA